MEGYRYEFHSEISLKEINRLSKEAGWELFQYSNVQSHAYGFTYYNVTLKNKL